MTTGTFLDSIASRHLTIADISLFDTPSTDDLPNGDNATHPNSSSAAARFVETAADFAMPWSASDFTVELWVRYTTSPPGTGQNIVGRYTSAETTAEWAVSQSGAATPVVRFALIDSSGFNWTFADVAMTTGAWFHVVFTLNCSLGLAAVSGRQIKAYKNGTLDSTTTTPTSTLTPPTLSTPRLLLAQAPTYLELGKVAVYHRIVTATEVADHYTVMTT